MCLEAMYRAARIISHIQIWSNVSPFMLMTDCESHDIVREYFELAIFFLIRKASYNTYKDQKKSEGIS